jgi:hypothetical protein
VIPAQSFVGAKKVTRLFRHTIQRTILAKHHVLIEVRRAPHRLARVVDDEIQPVARLQQVTAKRLDARRVAQVQPEDLQAMSPLIEIRLGCVAGGGVAREPGGDDELRPGTEELDAGLVAYLHPATSKQRHATVQVRRFGALAKIQPRAGRAELIVKVMDL